jgi:type I restriction enzyme M protein
MQWYLKALRQYADMNPIEQQFFNDLEKKLWTAADKLRSNLDAAVYKHVVLGLIFLKYVSDAFEERQKELREQFQNPDHDYYMAPEDYADDYEGNLAAELEVRDYYTEKNVFWVPLEARWQTLRDCAQLPPKAPLPWNKPGKDEPEEMRSVGWLIDNAMDAIERENEKKLKNVLNKDFARTQIDSHKLADLIAHFSDTDFNRKEYNGQPLEPEKQGHPRPRLRILPRPVRAGRRQERRPVLHAQEHRHADRRNAAALQGPRVRPGHGLGRLFCAERGVHRTARRQGRQWQDRPDQRLRPGEQPHHLAPGRHEHGHSRHRLQLRRRTGDTLLNDLHPDLRADFVMANPPFNMKEWWNEKLASDPRWIAGTPPQGNANFAWLQHMLYHLAPAGSMALLLANGSMSSNTNNEGEIRKKLIEDDYVECMVALPGQLFTNTQIPACIWFLTRDKRNGLALNKTKRDRRGQFLFIDARQLGYMKDRVLRDFTLDDIKKVADTFHAWQLGEAMRRAGLLLFGLAGRHPQARACADAGALCGRRRAGRGRRSLCRQDGAADGAVGGAVCGKCQAGGGDQEELGGVGL